jgi:predicted RecB family nuclease
MPEKRKNPFKLRDFRGLDPAYVDALEDLGIKTAEKLLAVGATPAQRARLAQEASIPAATVLEMVKLSDLARLPGVKGVRARLYYDAGIDSVEEMAGQEPESLLRLTAEFVERTGFDGIPPLPKEASSTIANARNLPRVVSY